MSRFISDIIGAPEPHFTNSLQSLEAMTAKAGHDARLIAELAGMKRDILQHIKLDHQDTTPDELYFTLRQHIVDLNERLEEQLNLSKTSSPDEVARAVVSFIDSMEIKRDVFAIKHVSVKQFLRQYPPKRLLRILGLKSIDSVLKRTNSLELLGLALRVEKQEWHKKYQAYLRKCDIANFDVQKSAIFVVNRTRSKKLIQSGHRASEFVIANPESGSLVMLTAHKRFRLDVLALTLTCLHALYDLQVYSAYYRYRATSKNFADEVLKVATHGLPRDSKNTHIGWRALVKHFNTHPESFESFEQPYLAHEDTIVDSPINRVLESMGEKQWPVYSYGFAVFGPTVISLHPLDIVVNTINNFDHPHAVHVYGGRELGDELISRYLQHPVVLSYVKEVTN
jgi:hypothetical protein